MFAVFVAVGVPGRGGMWYLERGWAVLLSGCFVVLTMRWPRSRFFARAFASVAATGAVAGLMLSLRPGSWSTVEWLVTDRLMQSFSFTAQMLTAIETETAFSTADVNSLFEAAAQLGRHFPALLGLSSLAGLAVAWWVYLRLSAGSGRGLRPLKEFRFNDHLVWLLLSGLALIVLGAGEGWTSAGSNAVVFMGGLYVLRGAAVLLFLNGGVTVLGFVFLAVGMVFMWWVLIPGTLIVGVGDTWLDIRSKAKANAAGKS
jgi:hypothetical protein